jgi:hypothetical protein
MEFDLAKTVLVFAALVAVGTAALVGAPIPMTSSTILMMVTPSMIVFGAICLALGIKHGEYRTAR